MTCLVADLRPSPMFSYRWKFTDSAELAGSEDHYFSAALIIEFDGGEFMVKPPHQVVRTYDPPAPASISQVGGPSEFHPHYAEQSIVDEEPHLAKEWSAHRHSS